MSSPPDARVQLPPSDARGARDRWEYYIAIFKFVKVALLLALAVGAISLLNKNVAEVITYRVEQLGVDPGSRKLQAVVSRLGWVDNKDITLFSLGTFLYAALFFLEGYGLYFRKRWGEWVTVVITGSFIPLELFELAGRFSLFKSLVILLNVATVFYLIYRIRLKRRERRLAKNPDRRV